MFTLSQCFHYIIKLASWMNTNEDMNASRVHPWWLKQLRCESLWKIIKPGMHHLSCYDQKPGWGWDWYCNGLEKRNLHWKYDGLGQCSFTENLNEGKARVTGGQADGTEREGTDSDWAGVVQHGKGQTCHGENKISTWNTNKGEGLNTGW